MKLEEQLKAWMGYADFGDSYWQYGVVLPGAQLGAGWDMLPDVQRGEQAGGIQPGELGYGRICSREKLGTG